MQVASPSSDPVAVQNARVSTMFVRALIEAVDAMGARVDDFLRAARVDAAALAEPYGFVDLAEMDRLACAAVAFTGDPAFGLHWVERSPMTKFDVMAMATAHSPTLREALSFVQRFRPVLSDVPELEIVERAHTVQLRLTPLAVTPLGMRVRADLMVAGLARLLRFTRTPPSAIRRVAFAHPAPEYVDEYRRILGNSVRFEQRFTGIEVEPSCLDVRLNLANLELHEVLTAQAQNVIARAGSTSGHAGRVRDQLRRMRPRLPDMPEVARALDMSVRSLRRRLDEEGCSYSAILDESRQQVAQLLLSDPTRSVKEIGLAVGFKNAPAFHRAFKRWTGQSPLSFRATKLQGDRDADVS